MGLFGTACGWKVIPYPNKIKKNINQVTCPYFIKVLPEKIKRFFEGWSNFKFINFGLALGMKFLEISLKFHSSVGKGLKVNFRKFLWLIHIFGEFTGEKLVGDLFAPLPSPRPCPQPNCVKSLTIRKITIAEIGSSRSFV